MLSLASKREPARETEVWGWRQEKHCQQTRERMVPLTQKAVCVSSNPRIRSVKVWLAVWIPQVGGFKVEAQIRGRRSKALNSAEACVLTGNPVALRSGRTLSFPLIPKKKTKKELSFACLEMAVLIRNTVVYFWSSGNEAHYLGRWWLNRDIHAALEVFAVFLSTRLACQTAKRSLGFRWTDAHSGKWDH